MTERNRAGARTRAISPPMVRNPLWAAILLAALLALAWQSFITQTHIHADPAVASTVASRNGGAHLASGRSSVDQPANCPICQEIAHAGRYLLAEQPTLIVPHPAEFWLVSTPHATLLLQARSPAWRSRAPPLQAQA